MRPRVATRNPIAVGVIVFGTLFMVSLALQTPLVQHGLAGALVVFVALELGGWIANGRSLLLVPLTSRAAAAPTGAPAYRPAAQPTASYKPAVARPAAAVTWTGERRTTAADQARELAALEHLSERLRERVRGQDHAIAAIAQALTRRAAGIADAKPRPLSILAAGPTGVGKTETAKALAEFLARPLLTYQMPNFADMYSVTGLIGSSPGYIGSGEPGRLKTDVETHPNAVLLFDEIEKAHPKVFDVLLGALDEGRVQEISLGQVADCAHAVFFFTSNLLQKEAVHRPDATPDEVRRMLLSARSSIQDARVTGGLRPEFINRIDLALLFRPLSRETVADIARAHLAGYIADALRNQRLDGLPVRIDQAVIDHLLDRADYQNFGVRDLQRIVNETIGNGLADAYTPWVRRDRKPAALAVGLRAGQISVEYQEAAS